MLSTHPRHARQEGEEREEREERENPTIFKGTLEEKLTLSIKSQYCVCVHAVTFQNIRIWISFFVGFLKVGEFLRSRSDKTGADEGFFFLLCRRLINLDMRDEHTCGRKGKKKKKKEEGGGKRGFKAKDSEQ